VSADDDDDDAPAITTGMEAPDAPDGTPNTEIIGGHGGASEVIAPPKGQQRVISAKARELFAKAAKSMKEQLAADDDEFTNGLATDEPEPVKPEETAAVAAAIVEPAAAPPSAPPPAAALDPSIEQHRQRLDMRQADLDAREKAIADREKVATSSLEDYQSRYYEDPEGTLVALIRRMTGAGDTDDITEEVADLITGLSGAVLKVPLTPEVKNNLQSKRALKTVKAHKAQLSKIDEAREAKRVAAQQEEERGRAVTTLSQLITKEEHAKQFPYLAAEDNAGALIFDVIETQHKRDGTMLQWTEAAKRANDYLNQQWQRHYDKRRHLLSAAPDKAPPKPAEAIVPQGDPSGIRRSHTITNAASAATATPKPKQPDSPTVDANGKWDRSAHRARTVAKYRAAFKPSEE